MSRRHSSLFLHVNSDPNPNINPTLWEHRLRQRRPISRNPFEPEDSSVKDYGTAAVVSSPAEEPQALKYDEPQPMNGKENSREEFASGERPRNQDLEWGDQVPSWLNLFYDLAWTATFSSLTSNNKFREPWDSVSYIAFFIMAWWMCFIMLIFTRTIGSIYYLYSCNSSYLVLSLRPHEDLTCQIIFCILLAHCSWRHTMLQRLPPTGIRLNASPRSRFESSPLSLLSVASYSSFSTFELPSTQNSHPNPAASLAGYLSSQLRSLFPWGSSLLPLRFRCVHSQESHMALNSSSYFVVWAYLLKLWRMLLGSSWRLVKAFDSGHMAQSLDGSTISLPSFLERASMQLQALFMPLNKLQGSVVPQAARSFAVELLCFSLRICTLKDLPHSSVKNQLLFSSFLDSATFLVSKISDAVGAANDLTQFNDTLRPLLLQGGISFDTEYQSWMNLLQSKLAAAGNQSESALDEVANEATVVWFLRVQLSATLNTYLTFMDNDSISETTYSNIQKYRNDYDFVLEDINSMSQSDTLPHFINILGDMLKPSADNGRYIMAICGLTFICLASMNLIQSWPRDRFQWASIFSRYAMGISMTLLLFLNLGGTQSYVEYTDAGLNGRAAVFRWIDANWVLPTLALAYAIQFIIDTALVYVSVWHTKRLAASGSRA